MNIYIKMAKIIYGDIVNDITNIYNKFKFKINEIWGLL